MAGLCNKSMKSIATISILLMLRSIMVVNKPETGICFELTFYQQQSNKSRKDTATDDVDDELGTGEGTCLLITTMPLHASVTLSRAKSGTSAKTGKAGHKLRFGGSHGPS